MIIIIRIIVKMDLGELAGDGGRLGDVVSERGLSRADGGHAGQLRCLGGRGHRLIQRRHGQQQLQTVLDPEESATVLPVLRGGRETSMEDTNSSSFDVVRKLWCC